jgi:hypothetical protein
MKTVNAHLLTAYLVSSALTVNLLSNATAQTTNWLVPKTAITNSIPANLFLTDNDFLFGFDSSGKRSVRVESITAAGKSLESRPAGQDPEGHWRLPSNGFQLSLRFDKLAFTNGEPVIATVLLRNVTNTPIKFLRLYISHQPSPISIMVFRGEKQVPLRKDYVFQDASGTEITIYPQTQRKYRVKLNDYYELTSSGEFIVQAVCGRGSAISSQKVPISIQ